MTMTFEEFFKKKRIDLAALQSGEPGLYSEFEKHFNQMGEKSFDHTKKYWFNKLRLIYHLAPELKPEKVHIENRLAEQTITESLLEEKIAAPSVGFKPRFKAGVEKVESERPAEVESEKLKVESETPEAATPKPAGFTPRFKAGVGEVESEKLNIESETPGEATPKLAGFTPRFKAGVTKPVEEVETEKPVESEKLKVESETPETVSPKPAGFTPRFKAGVTKTTQAELSEPKATEETPEAPVTKPAGFKPRFNMKTMAPKPAEDMVADQKEDVHADPEATAETPEVEIPAEAPASKPAGFKPRFNAKMMKPKPPEEEN